MTTTPEKARKKGSGIKGQPVRGFGPDIPDTCLPKSTSARRPAAYKGASRSSPGHHEPTLSSRDPELPSSYEPGSPHSLQDLRARTSP